MKNIAVIGAGTMGNGIAHTFAQYNYNVQLIDISQKSLNKGIAAISKNLDRMVSKEKITAIDKDRTLANITTYTSIIEGTQYASLVIEAATENLDLKLKSFFNNFLFKSALTLAILISFDSVANFSNVEFIIKHGPHHSAQKSIKTNFSFFKTESIFLSLSCIIFDSKLLRNNFLYINLNGKEYAEIIVDKKKIIREII